jgi:hypothetical protein
MPASVQPEARARRGNSAANPKYRRLVWRPLIDTVVSGLAFVLVTTMFVAPVNAGTSPAAFAGIERAASPAAVEALAEQGPLPIVVIATASSPADAVYRQTSQTAAWGLLGVAFSLMAALNLAFLRHLRQTYTPNLAVSTGRDRVCGQCGVTRY